MIMELLSVKYLVLYVYMVSAIYIHFRGKERHRFARQLTDHSTIMAPYNALMYLLSSVPTKPIIDVKQIPDLSVLRENWEIIREEAMALSEQGYVRESQGYNDVAFNSFFRRGWKRFYLKWYGEYYPSAKSCCPKTVELLKRVPGINAAMFTLLPAKSQLVRHRDPFAGSLRYHLGLVTPNSEQCYIHIDGLPYVWKDGEDVLFDETYIHRAVNETDRDRLILFCDVERPLRINIMTVVNRLVGKYLGRATTTRNVETERIGVINWMFNYVYRVRLIGKRLKAVNEKLYYLVKYSLLGILAYLIFL